MGGPLAWRSGSARGDSVVCQCARFLPAAQALAQAAATAAASAAVATEESASAAAAGGATGAVTVAASSMPSAKRRLALRDAFEAELARLLVAEDGATDQNAHIDALGPYLSVHQALTDFTAEEGTQMCVGSHLTQKDTGVWRGVALKAGQILLAFSNTVHRGAATTTIYGAKMRVFAFIKIRGTGATLDRVASVTTYRPAFVSRDSCADIVRRS